MDEIIPAGILDGIDQSFSHGWHSKYPPLHYYILSLFYFPLLLLKNLLSLDLKDNFSLYTALFFLGRFISVLMGTAIVWLVYRCGLELIDRRAALFSALITAIMGPFVFYAKITNVDIPYIFWFVFSLLFYVRILKRHLLADYLLFALTAVCAICTKDQAYGLYVLTPVPIVFSLYSFQKKADPSFSFRQAVFNRKIFLTLAVVVVLFALIHNLFFNLSGFIKHFQLITGGASQSYQIYQNTVSGHAQMLWQALKHLRFLFGWPLFIVCMLGLSLELFQKKNKLLFLILIPGISYYIFFISVVLYHYERFLIPIGILLSFFAGNILATFLDSRRKFYLYKIIMVGIVLGYSLWYAASVDMNMLNDSRYYVEAWMKKNIDPDRTIGMMGLLECLPRTTHFKKTIMLFPPSAQSVKRSMPEYVVFNPAITMGKRDLYDRLMLNELGYRLALHYRSSVKWILLDHQSIIKNDREAIYSNLDKINPEIKIFRLLSKKDGPGPSLLVRP